MSRDAEASSVHRGTRLPKVSHLPITPADKVRLKQLRTQQLPEMKSTEALRFPASSPLSQASRISPTQRLLPQRRHFSSDTCGPRGLGLDHTPRGPTPGGQPLPATILQAKGTLDRGQQGQTASFCREGKQGQRIISITSIPGQQPVLGSPGCYS